MHRLCCLAVCTTLVAVPLPVAARNASRTLEVIALADAHAAGASPPAAWSQLATPPGINDRGEVVFAGTSHATGQSGVWLHTRSGQRPIAQVGQGAPGTGATFASFSHVVLTDRQLVFSAQLAGPPIGPGEGHSIWRVHDGALSRIAQSGQEAPSFVPENQFSNLEGSVAANGETALAFFARTRPKEGPTAQSSGLWVATAVGVRLVAEADQGALPPMADVKFLAQSFETPFADTPIVNSHGQTLFRGFLTGPGIDAANLNGIWGFDTSSGTQLLLRAGMAVPGTPHGKFLSFPGSPTINDAGDTAVLAFFASDPAATGLDAGEALTGESMDVGHDHADGDGATPRLGLWVRRASGALEHVFSMGDHAPGISDPHGNQHDAHVTFVDTFDPVMNAAGSVALVAVVAGEGVTDLNAVGVWSNARSGAGSEPGDLELIARTGDAVPGGRPGETFGVLQEPALNAAGQAVFMAWSYTPDGDATLTRGGIWGQDRAGTLRNVAQAGDLVEVLPGDLREIASLQFHSRTGGEDGRPRGLNDLGEVALLAHFSDGSSAVLVSRALSIPEPTTAWLAWAGMLGILRRPRRITRNPSRARNGAAPRRDERSSWRRRIRAAWSTVGLSMLALCPADASAQHLYPDLIPYVDEDASYLVDWDILANRLRVRTMFANVGDGLLQIRADNAGTGGSTTPVVQRVFIGVDNGPTFEEFPVGAALNFHQSHGHIHLEDFSEFQLLEVVTDISGALTVGDLVVNEVKTSFRIHDSGPIPEPQYAGFPSYESSNTGLYQNVSVGHGDIYSHGTEGQSVSLAGVPVGPQYWLRQIVDPDNHLRETDETNNSFEILIDLNRPGEALRHPGGRFVRPGDMPPLPKGDLTRDYLVDVADWIAFRASAGSDLTGLDPSQAYFLGDLNQDGRHSLEDAIAFRGYYDAVHGAGAFAALGQVPEPITLFLTAIGAACGLARTRRSSRPIQCRRAHLPLAVKFLIALVAISVVVGNSQAWARTPIFSEDFESVVLGPNVDETLANAMAWTDIPPAGWSVDDSGVPGVGDPAVGITEWEGWSFADKTWWSLAASDQRRSEFTLGSGVVAVADSDEWNDRGNPADNVGFYNAWMTTPAIPLSAADPQHLRISFASSWRDECCNDGPANNNNQTAILRVSYDQGANFTEMLRWESHPTSPFFKNDATNELVTLDLAAPDEATQAIFEFGLTNAGNDWWWAIDNFELFSPSRLEVDVSTGEIQLHGANQLAGYEITSPGGSLNGAAWSDANLASQGIGSPAPLAADLDQSGLVDAADVAAWEEAYGADDGGDADRDGDSDGDDFRLIQQQFGLASQPGAAWETLVASDHQLWEFFLLGSSTFESGSLGSAYRPTVDARDLVFRYTDPQGRLVDGLVVYVDSAPASAAVVPEPFSLGLAGVLLLLSSGPRRSHPGGCYTRRSSTASIASTAS
jgi:hypothetical protein